MLGGEDGLKELKDKFTAPTKKKELYNNIMEYYLTQCDEELQYLET